MSSFFSVFINGDEQTGDRLRRSLVIFVCNNNLNAKELFGYCRTIVDEKSPKSLFILASKHIHSVVERAVSVLKKEFDGEYNKDLIIRPIHFTSNGIVHDGLNDFGDTEEINHFFELLKFEGLRSIFNEHDCVIFAPKGCYFKKPSKDKKVFFLRTANSLISSSEIGFMAIWILQHIKDDLKYIYCDTSSIFPIAQYACLFSSWNNSGFSYPSIESFESYSKVETYPFENVVNSIVMISASTSNNLCNKIISEKNFQTNQVLTIFYYGHDNGQRLLIFNTTKTADEKYRDKLDLLKGKYDINKLHPVPIMGEQFTAGDSSHEECLIKIEDAPSWISEFMRVYHKSGLIRLKNFAEEGPGAYELWLDTNLAFEGDHCPEGRFLNRLNYFIDNKLPQNVRYVIFSKNNNPKKMVEHVKSALTAKGLSVEYIAFEDFIGKELSHVGSALILIEAIKSARTIYRFSQYLRQVNYIKGVSYLVGIARTETNGKIREIENNVTMQAGSMPKHNFYCIEKIFLPAILEHQSDAWTREKVFLAKLIYWGEERGFDVTYFINRLTCLRSAGFLNDNKLFYNSSVDFDQALELRPGFAFFDFDYNAAEVSQSTVYLCLEAILHELRSDGRMIVTSYNKTVLSPEIFSRYSDGIIQAAILRAAKFGELDYSNNDDASKRIASILELVFERHSEEIGEASLEFLFCIASGRLGIKNEHLKMVLSKIPEEGKCPLHIIREYIRDDLKLGLFNIVEISKLQSTVSETTDSATHQAH